jgi:hypothetical protein
MAEFWQRGLRRVDGEGDDQGRKDREAMARGERLRAEIVGLLADGSRDAPGLLPRVELDGVSLSEVAFQLERLDEEARVIGVKGGPYRLA